MKSLYFDITILVHFLILLSVFCYADTNRQTHFQCSDSESNNGSATDITFQTNLRNLLDSLVANVPHKKGFYKTKAGKKSERFYGLVQCRGDISSSDCSNCTKNSIAVALDKCPGSREVSIWFRWCFLRYSDQNFFGLMDQTSIYRSNDTNFDDLSVVSKGLDFMSGLALTVQRQPLMFQTAVLDLGPSGKRYGIVQCNRDISRADCGKCLQSQLSDFRTMIGNKRDWEVYGFSCFMWYHDHEFYFNISTTTSEGIMRLVSQKGTLVRLIIATSVLLMIP